MRKSFTEQSAARLLIHDGYEIKGKLIIKGKFGKLTGLAKCSAMDYLVNHCGYKVV